MSGENLWRGILAVFGQRAEVLPPEWEDTLWIASLIDLAKLLESTRQTMELEHQGVLVAIGACIHAQIGKENEARDLAERVIAAARRQQGGEA